MTLFALALLCTQDSLQKPMTFETRAARISSVVPALSSAAGVQLAFNPQMANEVIAVSVKGLPLQVLLDKIAGVTSGEWKQEGEILRLQPSSTARNREMQEENASRLAWARKAIAEKVKAVQPQPAVENGRTMGGEERAIALLLKGLDPAPIGALNGGDRVVYSTNPTAMQRRLGADAPAHIAALVKEHNASVGSGLPPDMGEQFDQMPDFFKQMITKRMKKIEGAQKALLVVAKPGFGMVDMTNVELRLYDSKGAVAYSATSMLGSFDFASLAPGAPTKETSGKKPTEITYSADSKGLLAGFQGASFTGGNLKFDAKLLEKLRRPDLYDPLSYMATDELFSLAKLKGKALVANVPDTLMGSINTLVPGGKQSVEEFEADLKKGDSVALSETESWIVVKPAKPIDSRANRTDRVALAGLLKTAQEKGVPSLDDIAAFSLTSPSPMQDGIGMLFGMTLVPGLFQQGLDGMTNWDVLRFYGTLSPTQKVGAKQGAALQVGYLTAAQQALWRKIAFGATTRIRVGDPKADEMPFAYAMGMMGGNTSDYREEPTELMPNGLPPAATIQFASSQQPMASIVGDGSGNSMAYFGVMGPDELALLKMFKDDPNMAAMSGYLPSMDRLKVGDRTILKLTLSLPDQAYIRETLYDNRMPANAPVVTMANLPESFQKLIAERFEVIKKSPFGSIGALMGGMGRGPIKP